MKTLMRLLFELWIVPAFGKFTMTPTITYVDATGPVIRVGFNVALAGNYVAGGDTVNLATAAQDPAFVGMVPAVESLGAPIDFDCWDAGGDITYIVAPKIGTTASNNKVKIGSALGSEISGAYSGLSVTLQLMGEAVFNKL
jgi:hypothetical protein